MKIFIGSDKSGYELRTALEKHLTQLGHVLTVAGPDSPEQAIPFYKIAPLAAEAVTDGLCDYAILICGTGMGMSQVANKFKGVRAACVESVYTAKMSRIINDSNILCMGGWLIAPVLAESIVDAFLGTEFIEGLPEARQIWLSDAKEEFLLLEDDIYGE